MLLDRVLAFLQEIHQEIDDRVVKLSVKTVLTSLSHVQRACSAFSINIARLVHFLGISLAGL